MPYSIIEHTDVHGMQIKLLGHDVHGGFAIIFDDGALVGIAHQTFDYSCARIVYTRSVAIAQKGLIAHPAWKAPRKVEIA